MPNIHVHYFHYLDVTALFVPENEAFDEVFTNNVTNGRLPDAILMDFDLMRRIISNHLITEIGGVPQFLIHERGQHSNSIYREAISFSRFLRDIKNLYLTFVKIGRRV